MGTAIKTEELTKTYGRKSRGIKDVNLTVEDGEVFGFLGPNGAGKTTTVRTLLGFMKPTSGRAEVLGLDTLKDSVKIRANVGNLPGEFVLEDRDTGEDLLRYFARLHGVKDLTYARVLAERLGADLSRPMRRLSRGNKQKVGLIQAMFHKPPLLILDEPTGGLDPLVQEEFLDIVAETREEGRTVFFSSHVLSEVERVCDRVAIIREGELVAVEDTEDLTSKAFRHVQITFGKPLDEADVRSFEKLPGVENFSAEGPKTSFIMSESSDEVVKLAARHTVADIEVERPSLEEIFLTYYGGGESSDENGGN